MTHMAHRAQAAYALDHRSDHLGMTDGMGRGESRNMVDELDLIVDIGVVDIGVVDIGVVDIGGSVFRQ